MTFLVKELIERFGELIESTRNDENVEFMTIDSVCQSNSGSLVFVGDKAQVPSKAPAVMVTTNDLAGQLTELNCCVIAVKNVRLAQAKIKQAYQDYDSSDPEWQQIHGSAVIHNSASLGDGVRVGPNAVIGANVQIGAGSQIRANAVIEHDAVLGQDCIISPFVNIGYGCRLGNRVNLHTGVVIGNEGFGFAQDSDRDYHRIPHTGIVEIGNDVQIGANSNIDRGTYNSTVIGDGVKLDSLCHVAHNVHIDQGTLFASQACIAGSTYIGKRVTASGQVGVLDHLSIADNTVLVHRSGVTENIAEPGMYGGVPAKPFKEYVRMIGASKRIDKLNLQIKELKKQLKEKLLS